MMHRPISVQAAAARSKENIKKFADLFGEEDVDGAKQKKTMASLFGDDDDDDDLFA